MNDGKGNIWIWFQRGGLFAKYVMSLVGLVVFVLAVNGAMEIWITYGGIKRSLADGMSEKAEATAKRIEQSRGQWWKRFAPLLLPRRATPPRRD